MTRSGIILATVTILATDTIPLMAASTFIDWLCWSASGVIALLGLILLARVLIGDRSRGRRRCPRCWYDMGATQGLQCPECGRTARSERAMHRTRRRWRLALLALIALAAAAPLGAWPKARQTGWLSLIPTRAEIELLPLFGRSSLLRIDVERRLGLQPWPSGSSHVSLTEPEFVAVVHRLIRGNFLARPASPRWEQTYGDVWDILRSRCTVWGGEPTKLRHVDANFGPDAIAAFEESLSLPIDVSIQSRPRMPAGAPLPVIVHVKAHLPQWFREYSRLEYTVGKTSNGDQPKPLEFRDYTEITTDASGEITISGTLTTFVQSYRDKSRTNIDARPVTIQTNIGGSVDEILIPVRSNDLTSLLNSTLSVEVNVPSVAVWPGIAKTSEYDDCAFAVIFDLYDGSTHLLTGKSRWMGFHGPTAASQASCGPITDLVAPATLQAAIGGSTDHPLELRIRSDPDGALQILDAKRYWVGEFTQPFTHAAKR